MIARAREEASTDLPTSSTSSAATASLGSVSASNKEKITAKTFAPYFTMLEWANKSQTIVPVAALLHCGLSNKHTRKAAVEGSSDQLEVVASNLSCTDEPHTFWSKVIMTILDHYHKNFGLDHFF